MAEEEEIVEVEEMSDWAELPRERTRAEESRLREEAVREHEAVAEAANATAEAALGALRMYATDLRRDCGGCGGRRGNRGG